MKRPLEELTKVYKYYSSCVASDTILQDSSGCDTAANSTYSVDNDKSRIVDMDLDIYDDSRDVNTLAVGGKISCVSPSAEKWKFGMISLISRFFSVLHVFAWDILFELLGNECNSKVCERIVYKLCKHPYSSSSTNITDLVNFMNDMLKMQLCLKLNCVNILDAIHTLFSLDTNKEDSRDMESQQCLAHLADLVTKVSDNHLDWFGCVKLIDCICDFVLLSPQIGQTMIERLLLLLKDPDYQVRYCLARQIGVLFQTWDGHEELFHDICSNFGVMLVFSSK